MSDPPHSCGLEALVALLLFLSRDEASDADDQRQRTGDTGMAAYASFFHNDDRLLYVSAANVTSGVTVTAGNLAVMSVRAHRAMECGDRLIQIRARTQLARLRADQRGLTLQYEENGREARVEAAALAVVLLLRVAMR